MKKVIVTLLILSLLMAGVCCVPASAAGASMSFSQSTLRPGDSFSVTLNVSLSGALTVNGTISCSGPVSLTSVSGLVGTFDKNGNNFFIDLGNSAVSGTKAVAVASFKVSSSASVGETVSVSFSGNYSNLDGDYPISGSGSKTVAAPLSTNNQLASLTVGNATISPAFSAGTTSYTAEVPFSVSKLEVSATAADSKASVSVNSPTLTPDGTTNVTVTVTAESGAQKTYTISVKRAQDPNYVPSSENSLAEIAVEGFLLSPVFDPAKTDYVVWLPYETESLFVSATSTDGKASVRIEGGEKLLAGQDNPVKVICTAEDGTEKVYTVTAKRAAAHDGTVDQIPETEPETQPEETTQPTEVTEPVQDEQTGNDGIQLWVLVLGCVISFGLGALLVLLLKKGRKAREEMQ